MASPVSALPAEVIQPALIASRTVDDVHDDQLRLRDAALPEFTARKLTDPGVMTYRLVAGVADSVHLRADGEAAQQAIDRAVRPSSVKSLLRLIGTDIAGPAPALVYLTLTLGQAYPFEVTIPDWQAFEAADMGVRFVSVTQGVTIPASRTSVVLRAMQGERVQTERFSGTGGRSQVLRTTARDIVPSTIALTSTISTGASQLWTRVDTFAQSTPNDFHFMARREVDGTTRIECGDGRNGAVFADGDTLTFDAVAGGGSKGNVGARQIKSIVGQVYAGSSAVSVSVDNQKDAEGGTNEQTVEQARSIGPLWWRTQDRAVCLADFETLAKTVPGILDARATRVTRGTTLTVVNVALVGNSASGGTTAALRSEVLAYLQARAWAPMDITVGDARFVQIDMDELVRVLRGANRSTVEQTVRKIYGAASEDLLAGAADGAASALSEIKRYFFDLRARAAAGKRLFGDPASTEGHAYLSDNFALIDNTVGVDNLDISMFTRIPLPVYDFWRGDAVLTNFVPSEATISEELTVRFYSSTEFVVEGDTSGRIGTGVLGEDFVDDTGRVAFSCTGATAYFGDTARVIISPLVGNVRLAADEVFVAGPLALAVV